MLVFCLGRGIKMPRRIYKSSLIVLCRPSANFLWLVAAVEAWFMPRLLMLEVEHVVLQPAYCILEIFERILVRLLRC